MRYETISTDRRAAYYERAGEVIAADPLDFYCRAERGRRWQHMNLQDLFGREYEREQMLDAAPSTSDYDFYEELGQ